VDLRSVVLLGLVVSLVLSSVLSVVILPPTRALLRRLCPLEDTVAFWTRFTVLMLFLGPLLVTLIFGVPYSELSSKLTATDLIVRVISAALASGVLFDPRRHRAAHWHPASTRRWLVTAAQENRR